MKTIYNISILALALAALCSCRKADNPVSSELQEMTFEVSASNSFDTKTVLVGSSPEGVGVVFITANDKFGIFPIGVGGDTQPYLFNVKSVSFNPEDPVNIGGFCKNSSRYFALCPYNENARYVRSSSGYGDYIQTDLPSSQTLPSYAENTYDPLAGISMAEGYNGAFTLKNVCSAIRVSFGDAVPVSRLVLTNEVQYGGFLAGNKIRFHTSGYVDTGNATEKSHSVELFPFKTMIRKGVEVYFIVLPGTYSNLKLEVYDENNTLKWTRVCTSSVTFEPSKIYAFPEIDVDVTYMDFFGMDQFTNTYYLWD